MIVGSCAFSYCTSLKILHIPKSVIDLRRAVVLGCDQLILDNGIEIEDDNTNERVQNEMRFVRFEENQDN